ncbi:MAG: NUDIX domain-containing protein [Candidatus Kariarchaeaceae archaeon]
MIAYVMDATEILSGVVTFRCQSDDSIEVLLLMHGTHTSHPKGRIQASESLPSAAIRELKEETNLDLLTLSFNPVVEFEYNFNKGNNSILKRVYYFAGFVIPHQSVILSEEHIDYEWCSIRGGISKISKSDDRYALKQARKWALANNYSALTLSKNLALIG